MAHGVEQAAGQIADHAERDEQDRQCERRRRRDAGPPKNHTKAAWLVPMPLKVTGSSITSRINGTNAKYVASGSAIPNPAPRKYACTIRST